MRKAAWSTGDGRRNGASGRASGRAGRDGDRGPPHRALVVEVLDEVAADDHGVPDLARPVTADLGVAKTDLQVLVEPGRHPDGAEGGHGGLEQPLQGPPPRRWHGAGR